MAAPAAKFESFGTSTEKIECRHCSVTLPVEAAKIVCDKCSCHDKSPLSMAQEFAKLGDPCAWNTRVTERLPTCDLAHECTVKKDDHKHLHCDCGVIYLDMNGGWCDYYNVEQPRNCKVACQDCECGHICLASVYCLACYNLLEFRKN